MLMARVCSLGKWLGYKVKKIMATVILYLRSNWHVL